jgi:hypothetical protein
LNHNNFKIKDFFRLENIADIGDHNIDPRIVKSNPKKWTGGVAQWSSHPPKEQAIWVRIPRSFRAFQLMCNAFIDCEWRCKKYQGLGLF